MVKQFLIILISSFFSCAIYSQVVVIDSTDNNDPNQETVDPILDSAQKKKFLDLAKIQLPFKLGFSFDARRSFFQENNIKINGLKLSGLFNERYRVTAGVFFLSHKSKINFNIDTIPNEDVSLTFNYFGASYEYIFFKRDWLEISTPIMFGVGHNKKYYRRPDQTIQFISKDLIWLTEISASFRVNATRWFAVSTGFGYRIAVDKNTFVQKAFNDWLYFIQFKVNFIEVYKRLLGKQAWFGFK